MPNKTIEDLNKLYLDSESVDQEVLAEQRSNILLVAGNHYQKKGSKFWNRIRSTKELNKESKLRLTKNHIQKITKTYINNIISKNPSVKVIPRNENELQDKKSADMYNSIWQYAEEQLGLKLGYQAWVKDFIEAGECFVKIWWNPDFGKLIGYQPMMHEDGSAMADTNTGEMLDDETKPVFEGRLEIEKIFPSNLLRDPHCYEMKDAEYLIYRKMVPIDRAKMMVGGDPKLVDMIVADSKDEYMVFNSSKGTSSKSEDSEVMIREYYYKPSPAYPKGYFYITTRSGILFEGELPHGHFPIEGVGFDNMSTTPRAYSIIKQLRPYQVEINRTASKIAMHQVTSDDKVLIQSGTKISNGSILPGIRSIQYSGIAPTVLQGRTGDQYIPYLEMTIKEMYMISNVREDSQNKSGGDNNPWASLFKNISDQKEFVIYSDKFDDFIKRIATSYLTLAREYFDESMLIPAIDKSDYVNIPEFKGIDPVRNRIKVEAMSDDVNTMYGKTMAINHALQYVGGKMEKGDVGKMLGALPFGNMKEMFKDFTVDADNADNFMLALERGETPRIGRHDKDEYMIAKLVLRTRMSDFELLSPEIQDNYKQAIAYYENQEKEKWLELQRAEQGFIPSGGALVKADLQVNVPNSSGGMKTTRAVFPIEALEWLDKQLKIQGSAQDRLHEINNKGVSADIAKLVVGGQSEGKNSKNGEASGPSSSQASGNGKVAPRQGSSTQS